MATANFLWQSGAALTASGMACGAFGAHALKARLQASGKPENWSLASNYLIVNGVALLAISQHPRFGRAPWTAGKFITGGAILFSGSIFCLVLDAKRFGRFLGPVTPLGGLAMIGGYLALLF